ncbi:MAG: pseudouridine synthase [Polaromonas sp. 28-63-22]|nr:MAG: pseudouridine synthase [Polaromonas sp. 28-63-22]
MTDAELEKTIISGEVPGEPRLDELPEDSETGTEFEIRCVSVPVESHGSRLDLTVTKLVPEFSRSYLQQLIQAGVVQINGVVTTKTSVKTKAGDQISIELRPTPQSQAFVAEAMPLDIVYEDAHLLVVNKPAGLVVHPAPGNWRGTLLNGLLARDSSAARMPRAGIVHRLDKDTSGKTRQVDETIGRDPRNRLRMAVVDLDKNSGKTASTQVSLLCNQARYCLVKCKLNTGRTHQIRVHMAFLDHPLVGDGLYGGAPAGGLNRQALHAWRLAFKHPVTGAMMAFKSSPPADMQAALADLGLIYNEGE